MPADGGNISLQDIYRHLIVLLVVALGLSADTKCRQKLPAPALAKLKVAIPASDA